MRTARTFDEVNYEPGRQFKVIESCRAAGWTPARAGADGWGQQLEPGAIVTCLGYGPDIGGDPGYGIHWQTDESKAAGAFAVWIGTQVGTPFTFRPRPGTLEPVG